MRILFISSANPHQGIDSLILNQANSLIKEGCEIDHFLILGGVKSYLSSIVQIRRKLKKSPVDIIHAHYGLCGLVAVFAGLGYTPVVTSFMGSDLHGGNPKGISGYISIFVNKLSSLVVQLLASAVITKSENLNRYVMAQYKSSVIPNGINFDIFRPEPKPLSMQQLGLSGSKDYILFLGNTSDNNKNFTLLKQIVFTHNTEIIAPYPIPPEKVNTYLNATTVLVLTSLKEGSPNVIKEAMACNCPIVSTDVGDVRWVIGNTEGCYICSYDPADVAAKIQLALEFAKTKGRTNGRQRILELGLDSESVARRVVEVYKKVIRH